MNTTFANSITTKNIRLEMNVNWLLKVLDNKYLALTNRSFGTNNRIAIKNILLTLYTNVQKAGDKEPPVIEFLERLEEESEKYHVNREVFETFSGMELNELLNVFEYYNPLQNLEAQVSLPLFEKHYELNSIIAGQSMGGHSFSIGENSALMPFCVHDKGNIKKTNKSSVEEIFDDFEHTVGTLDKETLRLKKRTLRKETAMLRRKDSEDFENAMQEPKKTIIAKVVESKPIPGSIEDLKEQLSELHIKINKFQRDEERKDIVMGFLDKKTGNYLLGERAFIERLRSTFAPMKIPEPYVMTKEEVEFSLKTTTPFGNEKKEYIVFNTAN